MVPSCTVPVVCRTCCWGRCRPHERHPSIEGVQYCRRPSKSGSLGPSHAATFAGTSGCCQRRNAVVPKTSGLTFVPGTKPRTSTCAAVTTWQLPNGGLLLSPRRKGPPKNILIRSGLSDQEDQH